MADAKSSQPAESQVLLGLFAIWQIIYLLTANVLSLEVLTRLYQEPRKQQDGSVIGEAGRTAARGMRRLTDAWANLTLQPQDWGLFWEAPRLSSFPAVRLQWDNGRHES